MIANSRLQDLVRQARHELHMAELVTDEEFAELAAAEPGAVTRLEDYDQVRRGLRTICAPHLEELKALPSSSACPLCDPNERNDERQACWEDFVRVLRSAMKDAPRSAALKALHEAVFVMGWNDLGTGDGKPTHKQPNSAVSEWLAERRTGAKP